MRRNSGALAFWQQAIAGAPGLVASLAADSVAGWDGWVLRFRIAAPA